MADGWFESGDMGHVDPDGFLFISGRNKDVISVSGIKFFPQEIESVLNRHPSVQESRVYSVPHRLLGEVPVAEVVAAAGQLPAEADLKAYCLEHLAGFKVPARIQLVEKLPRTGSGKLIRRV
jgi:long-chain acyl-CoA synthetase